MIAVDERRDLSRRIPSKERDENIAVFSMKNTRFLMSDVF